MPVLTRFHDFMPSYSPLRTKQNENVAHIELFCRTMYGCATWYVHASPEHKALVLSAFQSGLQSIEWLCEDQLLVEIGQLTLGLMRAPALWRDLLPGTRQQFMKIVRSADAFEPHNNNWKLFKAAVKLFRARQRNRDAYETRQILKEFEKWYVGDGWYRDGPHFAMDYYNSLVILPFLTDCYELLGDRKGYERVLRYLQRQCEFLERLIAADGSYPLFGRSMVYRCGVFHALAYAAWKDVLPPSLSRGAVRAALTAVLERTFVKENYDERGFLHLGFFGPQPSIADGYSNNGSTYLALLAFLPLGLVRDHPFWTDESCVWTQRRAWAGEHVGLDKKLTI
jgi:hypothetical protein